MQNLDSTILVNFCILPPDNVANQCTQLSQTLKSTDTMFVLGDGKFPHMTVYMARFPRNVVSKLKSGAKQAMQSQKPFRCLHSGYFMTSGRYFEASYQKTSKFLELHSKLITSLCDFRASPGNPRKESYYGPYSAEQKKSAKQTGYDLTYDLYRPHITLTRYFENKVPEIFPAMPQTDLSFDFTKLGMYEADENGAVFKKLAEFTI